MKIKVLLCVADQQEASRAAPLDKHYEYFNIFNGLIKTFADLSMILRKIQPMVIVMSNNYSDDGVFNLLPFEYRKRWIRCENVEEIKEWGVVNCYMSSALDKDRGPVTFSVISSTYHSGDKIYRPYKSLMAQTYREWEWVIWEDSQPSHTECWEKLLKFQKDDIRIRCYRDCDNSGFIGEMKHRAGSMAKGDWIVELDHDDDIHPMTFEWCAKAIKENPDVDFISSDFVKFNETTGKGETFPFPFAVHYGISVNAWYNDAWTTTIKTNDIVPETIRHIVGTPNHIRCWKKTFYDKIGRHNYLLPVVDDYELLIRSYLEGNWLNVSYPCYIQYDNVGGNNFTYLRNSLIQHLVQQVRVHYERAIHNRIISLGLKDYSMGGNYIRGDAWSLNYKDFNHKRFIKCYDPTIDQENCIGIILTVKGNGMKEISSFLEQTDTNAVLYVIGNKSLDLETSMKFFSKFTHPDILKRIRWWNLREPVKNLTLARNYATRMLNTCPILTYYDEGVVLNPDHIQNLRKSLGDDLFYIEKETNFLINRKGLLEIRGDFESDHEEYLTRIQSPNINDGKVNGYNVIL